MYTNPEEIFETSNEYLDRIEIEMSIWRTNWSEIFLFLNDPLAWPFGLEVVEEVR